MGSTSCFRRSASRLAAYARKISGAAWLRGARAQSWLQLVVAFGVVHSPLLKASPTNYQRPFKKGIRSFLIILNEFKIQIVSPLEKLLGYARFIFTSFVGMKTHLEVRKLRRWLQPFDHRCERDGSEGGGCLIRATPHSTA